MGSTRTWCHGGRDSCKEQNTIGWGSVPMKVMHCGLGYDTVQTVLTQMSQPTAPQHEAGPPEETRSDTSTDKTLQSKPPSVTFRSPVNKCQLKNTQH